MMITLFQKMLTRQLMRYPALSDVMTKVYAYRPVDQTPPYIYMNIANFNYQDSSLISYGDIDINLVVRESGLIQASQLNRELTKMLNDVMQLTQDSYQLTFIFKILKSGCEIGADTVTKIYTYQGRLKIRKEINHA